jgi:hypothetical protein
MLNRPIRQLAVLIILTGCTSGETDPAPVGVTDTATESTVVLAFIDSYYDAMSERNWDRFAEHFWPDATMAFIFPDSTGSVGGVSFQSIPEFIAETPEGPNSREIFEERRTGGSLVVEGDLASGLIPYHARFGNLGEVYEWDGFDSFTLIRLGDEWRITHLAFVPEL